MDLFTHNIISIYKEKGKKWLADLQELRQWCYIHLVLAACWNIEDNIDPTKFIKIAEKFYGIL